MKNIYIIPYGLFNEAKKQLFTEIKALVERTHQNKTIELPKRELPIKPHQQIGYMGLHSFIRKSELLKRNDAHLVLVILTYDINGDPNRTNFVYGYSKVGSMVALVSLARITTKILALNNVRHEMGHAKGLNHCETTRGCLMEEYSERRGYNLRDHNVDYCMRCKNILNEMKNNYKKSGG